MECKEYTWSDETKKVYVVIRMEMGHLRGCDELRAETVHFAEQSVIHNKTVRHTNSVGLDIG